MIVGVQLETCLPDQTRKRAGLQTQPGIGVAAD